MDVADTIASARSAKAPVIWNSIFRKIGIDGAVDSGEGIIHSNEPSQAVFFSIKPIKTIRRYDNPPVPLPHILARNIENGKYVTSQKNKLRAKYAACKTVDDVLEVGEAANFEYIDALADKDLRLELIAARPSVIGNFTHTSDDEQIVALRTSFSSSIYNIHNLREAAVEVFLDSLATIPSTISGPILDIIPNPKSLNIQVMLGKANLDSLKNVSALRKQAVIRLLNYYKNQEVPGWFRKVANSFNIPVTGVKAKQHPHVAIYTRELRELQQEVKKIEDMAANISNPAARKSFLDNNGSYIVLQKKIENVIKYLKKLEFEG